jgi:hypothetical protein
MGTPGVGLGRSWQAGNDCGLPVTMHDVLAKPHQHEAGEQNDEANGAWRWGA